MSRRLVRLLVAVLVLFRPHRGTHYLLGVWRLFGQTQGRKLQAISREAPGMVKLSLALNVFAGILLLQLCIGAWREGAQVMAALFAVVWFSAFLLLAYVLPVAIATRQAFLPMDETFDPSAPQGRNVKLE